jgi:type I restriction enzyme S subunit
MKAGWKTVKLADVAEMRPPKSEVKQKGLKPTDEVGFLPMEDLTLFRKQAKALKTRPLSEVSNSYTYFANGDVLMAKISPCFQNGKMGIATGLPNGVGYGSSEYFVFRPSKELSAEWLYYYLQDPSFRRHATGKFSGNVGQQRLPKELIECLEIPLPPLAEQKRIVALLDEAFAGIDEAKAKAEERKLLSGELSDACLESFLSDDSGWITTSVSECADINTGFAFKSSGFSKSSTDVRLLGGDNIINGAIRWENIRRWPKGDSQNYQNFFLSSGDIVLAMDRPIVNSGLKIAMVCADDLPALLIQRTARLRAKDGVSADFLYLALNSARFINHLNNSQKGVGVPHVSARQIGSFSIKLPPRHEQERITTLLSKIISSSAHVALNSARALSNLSELKQSLLTKAFAGELTA